MKPFTPWRRTQGCHSTWSLIPNAPGGQRSRGTPKSRPFHWNQEQLWRLLNIELTDFQAMTTTQWINRCNVQKSPCDENFARLGPSSVPANAFLKSNAARSDEGTWHSCAMLRHAAPCCAYSQFWIQLCLRSSWILWLWRLWCGFIGCIDDKQALLGGEDVFTPDLMKTLGNRHESAWSSTILEIARHLLYRLGSAISIELCSAVAKWTKSFGTRGRMSFVQTWSRWESVKVTTCGVWIPKLRFQKCWSWKYIWLRLHHSLHEDRIIMNDIWSYMIWYYKVW